QHKRALIRSLRMIVDRSFLTRQPEYCATMRLVFGDDTIRTTRTHAKFLLVRNESWDLAVRTSMNLNENPRLENIEISDDRALADFLTAVVDDVFRDQAIGVFNGELPAHPPNPQVGMGRVRTGSAGIIKPPATG
ncbi:MAG: hypothetical protein ACREJ0_24010, partial [Geminicoccaceae bacterium]